MPAGADLAPAALRARADAGRARVLDGRRRWSCTSSRPRPPPLALFGAEASREVAALLAEAGIVLHTGAEAEVALAGRLRAGDDDARGRPHHHAAAPRGPGHPGPARRRATASSSSTPTRASQGVADVYAAGDVTVLPDQAGRDRLPAGRRGRGRHRRTARARRSSRSRSRPCCAGCCVTERGAHFLRDETERTGAEPPAVVAAGQDRRPRAGGLPRRARRGGRPPAGSRSASTSAPAAWKSWACDDRAWSWPAAASRRSSSCSRCARTPATAIDITLVAPEPDFVLRPLLVGGAARRRGAGAGSRSPSSPPTSASGSCPRRSPASTPRAGA